MNELNGLRVWVTRPAHQAETLCTAIEQEGGEALRHPLLTIEAPTDADTARQDLASAEQADNLILTSTNAVAAAWRLRPSFSPQGRLTAIGTATASALEQAAGRAVARPEQGDTSEDVLAMPALVESAGRHVGVITGENGRGHIQATLRQRHATVHNIPVYRRQTATLAHEQLAQRLNESDAIVITSGEALSHLVASAPASLRSRLYTRKLVVPSARVLKQAQDFGFTSTLSRPERMETTALIDALKGLMPT